MVNDGMHDYYNCKLDKIDNREGKSMPATAATTPATAAPPQAPGTSAA
jgi:hypothetical protein